MPQPRDVPAERPAALGRLEALVGEWATEASFDAGYFGKGKPAATFRGRATFEWFDGKAFLIQRTMPDDRTFPSGIMIIGPGASADTLEQHYYDSRGVARIYQMSLDKGVLRLWREAPGFSQRYAGRFSEDGKTIDGAWEKSEDGSRWERDFRLRYVKVG